MWAGPGGETGQRQRRGGAKKPRQGITARGAEAGQYRGRGRREELGLVVVGQEAGQTGGGGEGRSEKGGERRQSGRVGGD